MKSTDIACPPRAIQPAVIMTWLAIGVAAGCTRSAAPPAEVNEAAPVVYVVNYPLQYFAERVGGDAVDVRFPAPRDGDPAFWKPDTDAIAEYQSADLILLNGATYAKWIPRASLPTSRMVDTSASFGERLIDIEADTTHRHGPAGEHAHGGTAFTTWLDFDQAIAQAQAVHDALARRRPANADAFGVNLEALTNDLRKLDEQLMSIAREIDGEPLVASHPVYQYWARRYGFNLQSVTLEPDVVPDDRAMGVLKTILADHPAKIMIWEGDPDPRSVELLRTIGVRSVVFDPCGNIPDEGDFLTAMKRNTEALREVLAAVSAVSSAEPIAVAMPEPPGALLRQSHVRPHLPNRLNDVVDREFGISGEQARRHRDRAASVALRAVDVHDAPCASSRRHERYCESRDQDL